MNAVRTELKELVKKLLMGPLYQDENGVEILESKPLDTYLTGILWPVNEYGSCSALDESEQENLPIRETFEREDIGEGWR